MAECGSSSAEVESSPGTLFDDFHYPACLDCYSDSCNDCIINDEYAQTDILLLCNS